MPVPTETFWNIKKLNRVFAISAALLMATFVWAVFQDYFKAWREPQINGKVWEAALVDQKLHRDFTPQKQAEAAALELQITNAQNALNAHGSHVQALTDKIKTRDGERANLEFSLNTLKANVGVMETQLQNAITGGDTDEQKRLTGLLNSPDYRSKLQGMTDKLANIKDDILSSRQALKEATANRDAAQKQLTQLNEFRNSMTKKLASLYPEDPNAHLSLGNRILNKFSGALRAAPLMQFMNPAEKVQQTVVADVQTDLGGFKKVETLDRCTTCHVNIANKDFTREKIQTYLEEQVATSRRYRFAAPDPNRPATLAAPGADKPGPAAMPEFWHSWGKLLLPADLYAKTNSQTKIILAAVSKVKVVIDGREIHPTDITPENTDRVLSETVSVLLRQDPTNRALTQARNVAMQYADRLRTMLKQELPAAEYKELENRYRFAMVGIVNQARKTQGLAALDSSPVMLAHPRLDLYVDSDSKHPIDSSEGKIGVGCTSCHDGSPEETNFVLAAHVARPIWVDNKTGEPVLTQQIVNTASEKPKEHANLSNMLSAIYPEGTVIPTEVSEMHLKPTAAESNKNESIPTDKTAPAVYLDPVTGRRGKAVAQLRYWMDTYESSAGRPFELVYHEWDRPMLPPQYIQANCVRCHTETYDVRDTAPIVYEGRALFTRMGCVNCHQMDSIPAAQNRKVGPDLRHVTSKLSPEFINTWIWAPKAFRPTTKMPHFFMLENNSSDEEIRRTRQETRAITEYLIRTAEPLPPKHVVQPSYQGSAEAGHALFNAIGCLGCHNNLNDSTGETRARAGGLNRPVTVGEKWITQDLIKSGKLAKELKTKLGKEASASELSTEAVKMYDVMTYNERQMYVLQNLEQPGNGAAGGSYPDGTPKPLFIHHGPELSGVGTKLLAGRTPAQARQWLFDWLKEPRHYSDYTIMPQLRLSDQQAMDLAEYLLNQKRTNDSPEDPWKAEEVKPDDAKIRDLVTLLLKSRYNNSIDIAYTKAIDDTEMTAYAADALTTRAVDAKAAGEIAKTLTLEQKQMVFLGKRLIAHYGCMSCHAINGTEAISSPCANLSDWGQKQVGKLAFGYLEPEKIEEHEVKDVMAIPMVNALSARSCSLLTDKTGPMSKTIDVTWPEVDSTRTSWLQQKLQNTRVWDRGQALLDPQPTSDNLDIRLGKPYDKLKMPTFYLSDDQIHNLITFVLSNRDRLISDRLTARTENPSAVRIARGRELTERYNCVGCHQIENGSFAATNTAQVQQWYKPDELVDKAPPSLRGEGNKVQFAWLFRFFRNIEPMRPLLQISGGIRMPSFPATDDDWTAIIDYFNTISVKESKDLRQTLDPAIKYIATANKNLQPTTQPIELSGGVYWYNHPEIPPAEKWPGDDWIDQPSLSPVVTALQNWSIEKKQMTAVDFDVTRNSTKELYRSYRTALFKALFTGNLYDSPYPFVDAPLPDSNEPNFHDRFAKGQTLFHEMQCLNCHKLGDPDAAGAVKEPKGPNLSLVYQRLQRRWVRHWVQEPPVMQVNTKMPQFFSGLPILKIDGQPWAAAQGLPPAEIKRTADLYGPTVDDQTNLVLDYLYAAGEMRTTDVQPPKAPTAAAKPPAPK